MTVGSGGELYRIEKRQKTKASKSNQSPTGPLLFKGSRSIADELGLARRP